MLGSLIVVSQTGEILYHFKEEMVGDRPNPEELEAAIKRLAGTGLAACECPGED